MSNIFTFNNLTDLVRTISRLKKVYPDIQIISTTNNKYLNKLALGFIHKDLEINNDNLLTTQEYEQIKDKENYLTVLVLG